MRTENHMEKMLFAKIHALPVEKIAEVQDFVDFLGAREENHRWLFAAAKLAESPFARVWDNEEDADYDKL